MPEALYLNGTRRIALNRSGGRGKTPNKVCKRHQLVRLCVPPLPRKVMRYHKDTLPPRFGFEVVFSKLNPDSAPPSCRSDQFLLCFTSIATSHGAEVDAIIMSGLSPVATSASRNAWKRSRARRFNCSASQFWTSSSFWGSLQEAAR